MEILWILQNMAFDCDRENMEPFVHTLVEQGELCDMIKASLSAKLVLRYDSQLSLLYAQRMHLVLSLLGNIFAESKSPAKFHLIN